MTPEQIAEKVVAFTVTPWSLSDTAFLPTLRTAIATALREARTQALEEAAALSTVHKNTWGHENMKKYGSYDVATAIRALKHKDGQP